MIKWLIMLFRRPAIISAYDFESLTAIAHAVSIRKGWNHIKFKAVQINGGMWKGTIVGVHTKGDDDDAKTEN